MGFFDGLDEMIKGVPSIFTGDYWDKLWGETAQGGKDVGSGFMTAAAGLLNGAMTPAGHGFSQMGRGFGGILAGVTGLPLIRQIGEVGSWATDEVVKRPLGTFSLVTGDVSRDDASPGLIFSGDEWRQAYDDTRTVSAGQAATYWVMGGDPNYDPRNRDIQAKYVTNPYLKYTSGSLDAAVDLYADPTRGLGKLARLGKLKVWSGQMSSAATQKLLTGDKWQGFVDSRGYQKTYDFIKANSGSKAGREKIRQTVFNNHVSGGYMANALADVADDPGLYSLTYRALYGDPKAWDQLTEAAPRIADMTGSRNANFSISQVAKNYGVGHPIADQAASVLTETKPEAFADAMANSKGMWGQVGEGVKAGGLLSGQTMPRLRLSSQWRVGINNLLNFGPSTTLGNWFGLGNYTFNSITRTFLPSSRGGRHLDLNSPDSLRIFRNNLLQSRLDRNQVDSFTNMYSRATSPVSRFAIVNSAENAAFKAHAVAHGVSPADVEEMLPALNTFRAANRAFVNGNKRFASSSAMALAEKYRAQGMNEQADRAAQLGGEIDKAVAAGQYPSELIHALDEDGNLAILPLDSPLKSDRPALLSQTADTHVLQDWGSLDSALWWRGMGGLGKGVWASKEALTSLAEAAMSVWKISAILRPGYLWRPLTDEAGGPLSVMGSYRSLGLATEGVKNSLWNTVSRGSAAFDMVRQAVVKDKAGRIAGRGRGALAGSVVDEAPTGGSDLPVTGTHPDLPGYVFGGTGYRSYDHALADGLISVQHFMSRLMDHGTHGNLPDHYQAIFDEVSSPKPSLSKAKAQRMAVDAALSASGRDVYQSTAWQQALIDAAIKAKGSDSNRFAGNPVIVDPFSGTSPKLDSHEVAQHFNAGNATVIPAWADKFDRVYRYIHDNINKLLSPSNLLHAHIQPDGKLALSVASLRKDSTLEAVKPSAGVQLSVPFADVKTKALRAAGQTGFDVVAGGRTYHIRGGFEGQKGDLFQRQASSAGVIDAWVNRATDTSKARLMAMAPVQFKNVDNGDPGYGTAWERAVMQLGHDPVAKQFLKGATPAHAATHERVVDWIHNTSAGRAWQYQLGPYLPQYWDQVHLVHGMVDTYVPFNPAMPVESAALRKKVADGTVTFADLKRVVSTEQMPQVHGATLDHATGSGWFPHMVKKWTADIFRTISDMPNDKILRYPFAAERFKFHTRQLMSSRAAWLKGEEFSQADLDAVAGVARDRALVDVRRYLYDSMATSDLAKGLRLLVPFGSAIYDSAAKWGTVFRENPARMGAVWTLWSAPDRAGLVQDNDGNQLEVHGGKERWWYIDESTGQKVYQPDDFQANGRNIVFQLPTGVSPTIDGAKVNVRISKQAFQTFLDIPTFGPLVAVPVNKFALDHPEWAANRFVQSFILPYGPSANGASAAVPGNVRNWKDAWDNFVSNEDTQQKNNQAVQIWATEMVNYSQGRRNNAPTFEEARQKASQLAGLTFLSRLSGATANFTTPYQGYIDYYHMLEAKQRQPGDPSADEEFYNTVGPEFFWLTAKVTRNALGIPATLQSDQAYKKYADLMQQFPDLAPLIEGSEGAGAFNKAVYEAQKATSIRYGSQEHERELMPMQWTAEDVQRRMGWAKYMQFADALHADMAARGLTNLSQKGAADLAANKAAFLESNMYWEDPYGTQQVSPWYQDYSTTDQSKIEGRLTQMRQIVQDSRLQGRDDIQGLIDYLDARDQFKAHLSGLGIKQLSIKNKKSVGLANQWAAYLFNLKEGNLAFSQLYDRWLTHDDTLAAV